MPDRIVRENILDSDTVNSLSWAAEVFYRRLMSKADDYGRYEARTTLLRSQLYPVKIDKVSCPDVEKWLAECAEAGLVRVYRVEGKDYLQIEKFQQRLRAMRSRYPEPPPNDSVRGRMSADDSGSGQPRADVAEENRRESESETETEGENAPAGAPAPEPPGPDDKEVWKGLNKTKKAVIDFIESRRPSFLEPYATLWNLFADGRRLPKVASLTDSRRKKIAVRLKEKNFDLIKILARAKIGKDFLLTGSWFSFDWIIENDSNYLKILEGNYDKTDAPGAAASPAVTLADIDALYAKFIAGQLKSKDILEPHCDLVLEQELITLDERFITRAIRHRIKQLTGSNKASDWRIIQAYETGTWPADPDCQADAPHRERIAKKIALWELFEQSRALELKTIIHAKTA